ncbi:MAG: glycosyltransferase family 2 protein, partial [Cucumibacter sp.]
MKTRHWERALRNGPADNPMTAPPLVSVIVPAFNAERFIVRTLKSAQAQTLRNIEFIVVDDGSTDATATLAMGLAETDRRIHVIRSVNQGVAAARNLGLKAATGTYVAFLDADDLWHSEKVLRQVEAFRRFDRDHTAIGAVYALCRPVDDHDRVIGSWEHCEIEGWVYLRHLLLNFVGNGSSLMCPTAVA